jgi:TM2 domain-containing membrane protein YozV
VKCSNHPSAEAVAYCQQCGKPLCTECTRPVGGMIFCESCVAARMGVSVSGQAQPGAPVSTPNPLLAGVLGFIPGVGAMYNGQFVKALAHVLIFAVFVSLSHHSFIFGLLIPAWVFYQVFDAHQTAKARLEGLPLPNPFGLNDLGARLGIPSTPTPGPPPYPAGFVNETAPPGTPASGFAAPGNPNPQAGPYTPPYPNPPAPPAPGTAFVTTPVSDTCDGSRAPVGAIVLIVIGLFLLFQTLGLFRGEWVDRSWPLLIVGLGAWLLYRRTRGIGGPQ